MGDEKEPKKSDPEIPPKTNDPVVTEFRSVDLTQPPNRATESKDPKNQEKKK